MWYSFIDIVSVDSDIFKNFIFFKNITFPTSPTPISKVSFDKKAEFISRTESEINHC